MLPKQSFFKYFYVQPRLQSPENAPSFSRETLGEMLKLINQNIESIKVLCAAHKVKTLYAFGSVVTDRFTDQSDIDLLVDFSGVELLDYADNYFDLKFSLENTFKRSVDLIEQKAIKNPYFKSSVEESKQLNYG